MANETETKEWLAALDAAEAGRWEEAHEGVQSSSHPIGSWIHANLHREEGDDGNAAYWYSRAGRSPESGSLAEEREKIREAIRSLD